MECYKLTQIPASFSFFVIASEQFLEHFYGFSCSIGQSESQFDLSANQITILKTCLCEPVDFIEVFDATDKCDPLSE